MNWEDRKKVYNSDYYDGELENHYREWWWTDLSVWFPRAMVVKEAFLPQKVLDCGCAKGSLVKFLRSYNIESHGFDLSEYAINATPFPEIKPFLFVLDCAENDIPFADNFFDVVCCFDILEHNDDDHLPLVINRIARVSKKHILIRQPFYNFPDNNIVEFNKAMRNKPLIERWSELRHWGAAKLKVETDNIEHPNTIEREYLISLVSGFKEVFLNPVYYDILMGSDLDKCVPVLPFYETIVLERI